MRNKYSVLNKTSLLIAALIISFCSGFAFKTIISNHSNGQTKTGRVTGIGGIFFKAKDPAKMRDWYKTNLGLNTNQYGAVFEWYQGADSTKKGFTTWSAFKETSKYFEPSTKDYMVNYRVVNLESLLADLKKNGVTIVDTVQAVDYGKFVHIMDLEGNSLELWEPNDVAYEKFGKQLGAKTTK